MNTPNRLLTPAEAAVLLRTSTGALRVKRQRGTGPAPTYCGSRVFYSLRDINAYAKRRDTERASA